MTKRAKDRILYKLNLLKSMGYNYHESLNLSNHGFSGAALPSDILLLKNIVENCYLCDLSKSRKNILFGEGNKNSSLMLICDEPTSTEDELKEFYVGKTGETLVKIIENVLLLKKEDVYITHLVKCKSSDGLKHIHFDSCSAYLNKQIELINPKLIVTFGEKTYQYFCNNNDLLSKVRGQLIDFKGFKLLPTFSISHLLRNPSLKKEMYYDMLKIKTILESN